MPKTVAPDELQEALDAFYSNNENKSKAARSLNMSRSKYRKRLDKAFKEGLRANKFVKAIKPRIRVKAVTKHHRQSNIVVIPDAHDSPKLDKDRFEWMGKYIAKNRPDKVVIIGDFADFESLCSHVRNDTWDGKFKPSFVADLVSMRQALERFMKPIQDIRGYYPEIHLTLGNHEHRLWLYEKHNPEVYGMMQHAFFEELNRYDIIPTAYGVVLMVDGVGFTHIPWNERGKPYGGKTAKNQIARDSLHDIVFGHTHKFGVHTEPKIGTDQRVKVVDVGTALPHGYVEDYAKHSKTGWSWGIVDLTVVNKRIESVNHISMVDLENQYS